MRPFQKKKQLLFASKIVLTIMRMNIARYYVQCSKGSDSKNEPNTSLTGKV